LPANAPDHNPVEGPLKYLKRVELGNVCCTEVAALGLALRRAKERARHKRGVLRACITQCGYHV
jgi:hypothetical protein